MFPLKILCSLRIVTNLLVIIFVISFQAVLIRHIGLVFLRWQFQSVGLRIEYMVAFFHWEGICPELKQSVTMSFKCSDREGKRFLIISYKMPEGSDVLSLERDDMVKCYSSSVEQIKRVLYIELLIDSSGV